MMQKISKILKRWVSALKLGDALREITFIVIGILLAFSISNWNERNKEKDRELLLLKQLHSGLTSDLSDLKGNSEGLPILIQSKAVLLNPPADLSTDSLKRLFDYFFGRIYFAANLGPYESLKSQGIQLLENDSLRTMLPNLYEYTYKVQMENERRIQSMMDSRLVEFHEPYLIYRGDTSQVWKHFQTLKSQQRFVAYLTEYRDWDQSKVYQYQYLGIRIQELLDLIQREIDILEGEE